MQAKAFCFLLCALFLQGCSENAETVRQVHTSFSESAGLTVTEAGGLSQQLIAESLGVRVVISPSADWILVEDMQLSNLVVIRAFRYVEGAYRESGIAEMRPLWEKLASQAGIAFEDLVHTRVGIEKLGPAERSVFLHFQADSVTGEGPGIDSVLEIDLDAGG